jgi:hypothetical protein
MTPTEQQQLLASLGADVEAEVLAAYNRAMELMRRGTAPRDAIQQVMDSFTGQYAGLMSEALSAVLQQSVGTASVLAIQVGEVALSRRLYAEAQSVSNTVQGIVQRHVAGMQDARRLALELFEGYNFRDPDAEPLQISRRNRDLPRYLREVILTDDKLEREMAKALAQLQVDGLATPALRAAYNGVLEDLDGLDEGVARDVLEKRLKVAFFERVRYFAERIAKTELHKAYATREASILLDDEEIEYVQIRRSRTGKAPCICSLITGRDQYGLGPGVYPKAVAPNPPFHPFCRCISSPRLDLTGRREPQEKENADQYFLRRIGQPIAAQIVGSKAKLQRVLNGESALDIANESKDPAYRIINLEQAANAYSATAV